VGDPFNPAIHAGTVVEVDGASGPGDFAPIVDRAHVRIVAQSSLPKNAPLVDRGRLMSVAADGQWVAIEGILQSVKEEDRHSA
jgi:hypothetical protein